MKKLFTLIIIALVAVSMINESYATTCAQAVTIPSFPTLPYLTTLTCGTTDDITSANSTACGSGSYKGGWEAVYVWTPGGSYINVSFAYSGQTWTGIFLYQGCPTSGGTCIANFTSSSSSKTLAYVGTNMTSGTTISLTSGVTYYIVIDTYPTPNSPCPGTMTISGTLNRHVPEHLYPAIQWLQVILLALVLISLYRCKIILQGQESPTSGNPQPVVPIPGQISELPILLKLHPKQLLLITGARLHVQAIRALLIPSRLQ